MTHVKLDGELMTLEDAANTLRCGVNELREFLATGATEICGPDGEMWPIESL